MNKKSFFTIILLSALSMVMQAQEWTPVEINNSITHPQPMTGLVLWPEMAEEKNSTYNGSITLEFSYCLPCKVVKGCNTDGSIQYDWTWFDNILADVASRGHQLIARFRYEYPSGTDVDGKKGTTAVPQYIKDRSDYHETYSANPGGDGPTYYADWSNAELQRFTLQFYTDFAQRYAHDNRLAFLEVGFGHWAEYHIYGTPLQLGTNFPSWAFQKQFLLHMGNVMTEIPWGISKDAADDTYTPIVADNDIMAQTFGMFDDSFMHKTHEIGTSDGYNEECWNALGKGTRWQTGVCGGEISYYTSSDQKNFLNPAGMYGHTWEEQSAKYHITFMIANDAPRGSYGTATRFREASMETGYKIKVKKCETDGTNTRLTVTNEGIAPLYRDAYFAIGGVRCLTSLKGLLPGEEEVMQIAAPLTDASDLKIESDCILSTQEIEFIGTTDESSVEPAPVEGENICYFVGSKPSSEQVKRNTGNSSNNKGIVTYAGKSYDTCIKMEDATSLDITPTHSGNVTLIFGGSTSPANQTIKVDGTKVTLDADGQYTFPVTSGTTYNLGKGDKQLFLYLIILPDGKATAINNVNGNDNGNELREAPEFSKSAKRYTLSGQPAGASATGITIQGGKKIIY